jgi:hypothetical protein
MERFNPECDLPAGAEVDVVRILQADTLPIAAEHDTIGAISWTLHTTACTCLTSRSLEGEGGVWVLGNLVHHEV